MQQVQLEVLEPISRYPEEPLMPIPMAKITLLESVVMEPISQYLGEPSSHKADIKLLESEEIMSQYLEGALLLQVALMLPG